MKPAYSPASHVWCWLLVLLASLTAAHAQQAAAPSLRQAATYGLLSGAAIKTANSVTGDPLAIRVQGQAGAADQISRGVQATAGVYDQGSGTVPKALVAARKASDYCTSLGGSSLAGQLDGQLLQGGVYEISGDALLGGGASLTLTGDTASVFVLNITGSLQLEKQAQVVLDGVQPQHVFWNVTKNLVVDPGARFSGVALTGGSAALRGIHFGSCALLSQQAIVLTDLSAVAGSSQFFAGARPTGTCDGSQTVCSFTPPDGELIQDGSFEVARCLPDDFGGLEVSNGTNTNTSDNCYWQSGTEGGTADYYYTGAGYNVSVPYNPAGGGSSNPIYAMAQNSATQQGNAYAGFIAYEAPGAAPAAYYEYIGQQHPTDQLLAGHKYYAEFDVHWAPASGKRVSQLGMAIVANTPLPLANSGSTQLAYPMVVSGSPIQSATTGPGGDWHRIGGVFSPSASQAGTGFTVLIGNFLTNPQNPGNQAPGNSAPNADFKDDAYYFVDNVTLSMVTEAGSDRTLTPTCQGSAGSTTLGTLPMPALVGATYAWTASPADPSLTTPNVANPVVSPTQTTTYTLTVSFQVPVQGQQQTQVQPYSSTVTVTVNATGNNYVQNAGATYVNPLAGGAAYDLGVAGTTTTLSGSGGTVLFDGHYHVRGDLLLTNGTYSLTPGTVFYVDGVAVRQPTASGVDQRDVRGYAITLGDGARLVLDGATLTASGSTAGCPMWRGLVVDGSLPPNSPAQVVISNGSVVSHAYCALTITRNSITAQGVAYSLTGSSFLHNLTHVLDMGIRKRGTGPGGAAVIQNCTFDADPAQLHYPYNATTATDQYVTYQAMQLLPFNDPNSDADAVEVENNTIGHAIYGIVNNVPNSAESHAVRIRDNTLTAIYQLGVWAVDNQAMPQAGSYPGAEVSGNVVTLSDWGGQVTEQLDATTLRVGLSNESSQVVYHAHAFRANTVYGQLGGSRPQVGLHLSYQVAASGNQLVNLEEGIRTTALRKGRVFDNRLLDCGSGVSVQPSGSYGYDAQIGCNSFQRDQASGYLYGIWTVPDADVNDQGDSAAPAGNAFTSLDEKVRNDGSNPGFVYWSTSSSQEAVTSITGGTGGTANPSPILYGGYCSSQGASNGVNRGTLPSPGYIAALADTVRRQLVPRPRRRAYLGEVLGYYLAQDQVAGLEAWWATLLPGNAEDYRTTGLTLLAAYDQRPATAAADARRVLAGLQPQAMLDADLAAELALRAVERHLPQSAPALMAADSTALTALAWSGAVAAGRAGRWLRYFHPRVALPTVSPEPLRVGSRPAVAPPAKPTLAGLTAQLGEAYPNPARTEVSIACQLPAGAAGGTLCFTNLVTGRPVLEVPVPKGEQPVPLRIALDQLAAGTYAYRLLVAGRPVAGTRKLVVLP